MTTSIILAVLMLYMLFCSVKCVVMALSLSGGSTILFSLIITYGVYVFSSILALDPWHMITSFGPYMLLTPTYVNILNMRVCLYLCCLSSLTPPFTIAMHFPTLTM